MKKKEYWIMNFEVFDLRLVLTNFGNTECKLYIGTRCKNRFVSGPELMLATVRELSYYMYN